MKRPDGREEDANERILRERAWGRDPRAAQLARFFWRDGVLYLEVTGGHDATASVCRTAEEADRERWAPEWLEFLRLRGQA